MLSHPIARIATVAEDRYEISDLRLDRFSELRLWLFDLEATGLDTSRERITQVAGIPLEGGRIVEDGAFTQLVYPGESVEIPKEVQDLTAITPERLIGAPSLPSAWADCVEAAAGCDLWMGQSVFEFDVPLLEAEFARHGMPRGLPPILDSVALATVLLGEPEARWSTNALLQRFGVDTEGLRRHDALDDVKILGRILVPMIELIRSEHEDLVHIPADNPVAVKRHPPVKSDAPPDS